MSSHGGISRICQRARLSVAKTGDIVFVSAEVLLLGGPASNISLCKTCTANLGNYFSLNEQNCWLITCQTISSDDIMGV
jgi:hypothetical protein